MKASEIEVGGEYALIRGYNRRGTVPRAVMATVLSKGEKRVSYSNNRGIEVETRDKDGEAQVSVVTGRDIYSAWPEYQAAREKAEKQAAEVKARRDALRKRGDEAADAILRATGICPAVYQTFRDEGKVTLTFTLDGAEVLARKLDEKEST